MQTEDVGGKTLETWTVEEAFKAWQDGSIVLIDVRSPQEYMFEHIDGSLLMPMASFAAKGLPDQGDKPMVMMCGSGVRSEKMARVALDAGEKKIAHIKGGFGAWKEAKKPYIGIELASGAPKCVNG